MNSWKDFWKMSEQRQREKKGNAQWRKLAGGQRGESPCQAS